MTTSELLISTLSPVVGTGLVSATKYTGTSGTYCTFNFEDSRGLLYADDKPITDIDYVQVHLFTPRATSPHTLKKSIIQALFGAGFSYPSWTLLYDEDAGVNHLIISTTIEKTTELED